MADSTSVQGRRSIGAHGVIGDLRTCALVATDGTIDHFCWPNLDSPSVFAALLDSEKAGYFSLAPVWEDAREQQLYLPDTNILQTRWLSAEGVAEITDLMPVCSSEDTKPRTVRRVQVVAGRCRFRLVCAPAHDYARAETRARLVDGGALFEAAGQPTLRLASSVTLRVDGNAASAEFELEQGEQLDFVFGCKEDDKVVAGQSDLCFEDTLSYWTSWAAKSHYQGRWREMVTRSALALKLLTSCKHGSIAAAATFSRPRHWVASATGTIAPPGSATPPLPSTPSCAWATPRKPRISPTGWASAWKTATTPRKSCRSCIAWTAGWTCPRKPSTTWRAMQTRVRCASATRPTSRSSWTSTAS